jgi:hypothetical protein
MRCFRNSYSCTIIVRSGCTSSFNQMFLVGFNFPQTYPSCDISYRWRCSSSLVFASRTKQKNHLKVTMNYVELHYDEK